MVIDEAALADNYALTKLTISSGTQVSSRVSAIVGRLGELLKETGSKPVLLNLTANAKTASKLISIVEIAKRELAKRGIKCFQYTVLTSRMIEMERKSKAGGGDGDESDPAFETMEGVEVASMKKKRNVPVLTIYVASTSIKELKAEYTEQV